jgi:hypothetical protein
MLKEIEMSGREYSVYGGVDLFRQIKGTPIDDNN